MAGWRTTVWLGLLLTELVAPTITFPQTRPQGELYPSSPLMESLTGQPQRVRLLDYDTGGEHDRASILGIGAPQALVRGIPTLRGYNPLDVGHYREFVALVAGETGPVRGNSSYTQQVLPNIEVKHPQLFHLLGVTHRLAPADSPVLPGSWRTIATDDGPVPSPPLAPRTPSVLAPHTLAEAVEPHPRAWIVPCAEIGGRFETDKLKQTDFTHTVLISGDVPLPYPNGTRPAMARIVEYRPNRVVVELDDHTGGWLVLSDVWYPGWVGCVDNSTVPVVRANHAFRAVPVHPGAKYVQLTFAPRSYRIGCWISACSVILIGVIAGGGMARVLLLKPSSNPGHAGSNIHCRQESPPES